MVMKISPDANYGMKTNRDYVVAPTTKLLKIFKNKKIVASSKIEIEIKKELPMEL